jgi:hypothetical protein
MRFRLWSRLASRYLARAQIAVGAGPHVPTGLGGDDQFVAVGKEVFFDDLAEGFFGRSVGRAVIIGEIEMRDAEIEGAAQHGAEFSKLSTPPKLCQRPSEMAGSWMPLRPERRYCMES